ncbi:MAG: helix-turn-helix domain-containing protein [Chloroflexi bacterium]|nr:helix-turn-helix domain-containing protein [Chloroflexota bacterium]MCC6896820.1 AraC family transcriptional regulator [Anaerolineae bacterium]
MIPYREFPPHPALAPYVACYWSITSPLPLINRILPDGCTDIVVTPELKFVGAMRSAFVSQIIPDSLTVGIRFKPGGSSAFFRLPLNELTDNEVTLDNLWGRFAHDLTDQLAAARTAREKIAHLEAALLCRLDQLPTLNPTLQQAVSTVRQANGDITITDLRTRLALSERQLERGFHQWVGLSPRQFARVTRFRQVVDLLHQPALSLTQIAYRAGYYDQAHFIHDFKSLAGLTPRDYRREQQDVGFLQFPAVTA